MSQRISRLTNPEEEELAKKRIELSELESLLVDQELNLTELRLKLSTFERRYVRTVGKLYAELDEIEAKIAEEVARIRPSSTEARNAATQARDQASASRSVVDRKLTTNNKEYTPSESQTLKNLYREVAKRIHPDLATDSVDCTRRQHLMTEANRAYEEGDENRLRAILEEYELSPELVKGSGTAADLVRVIRKIAQVRRRLVQIDKEVTALKKSELFELKLRVDRAAAEGRDLLEEMSEDLHTQIALSEKRLREAVGRSQENNERHR